jgi:hypothetical protein
MMKIVCIYTSLALLVGHKFALDAKAVFEKAVASFKPDKARLIWERWSRHQYQYGTLQENLKLEQRLAEAFPTGANTFTSQTKSKFGWLKDIPRLNGLH